MAAPILTASRVDLFRECAYSVLLPQTSEDSEAAARGTAVHAEVLRAGHLPQKALDWFGGRDPRYEATFALEILPLGAGREYGRVAYVGQYLPRDVAYDLPEPSEGAVWVAGTADAAAVRPDAAGACLSLADLKTGYGQTRGSLPHPSRSGQLLLLASMLRLWRESGGRGEPGVLLVPDHLAAPQEPADARHWPAEGPASAPGPESPDAGAGGLPGAPARDPISRVRLAWVLHPDDGPTRLEDTEVEPGELADWTRRFSRRVRYAASGSPPMRPGHHCAHCPCFDACPAQGGALRRLSEMTGGPLTADDAAIVAAAIPAAERQIASARRALRLFVERAGGGKDLPIGGGKALRVIRGSRRDVDARIALQSGVVDLSQARVTVTQASIRDGNPSCDVDAVMDALEQAGAVTHVQTAPHVRVVRDDGASEDV